MDFLDPKKERQNRLTLLVGYALITLAIGIGSLILLYVSYGFGIDKKGQVIQSGLVFASSQPSGADIYLNNTLYKSKTDTRMVLPSGEYQLKLAAAGYRDWERRVVVDGSDVQHFDYPFLFPNKLQTKTVATLDKSIAFSSQSPDRRWQLIKAVPISGDFLLYDFKNPVAPVAATIALPATLYTPGTGAQVWTVVEWSSDNRRVLLKHDYTSGTAPAHEYIVVDRADMAASVNVSTTLQIPATEELRLFDKKYDQYYAFDVAAGTLRTTSLKGSLEVKTLSNIVAFKSYGSDMLLYVTTQSPTGKVVEGKVSVVLQQGQKTLTLRTLPASAPQYNLDVARYDGKWYVVAGASSDAGVYIYKDPQSQTTTRNALPAPWRFLKVANANRVSFSTNAQFVAVQGGQNFMIYDAENIRTYRYTATQPIDQPQQYATWMDGSHLTYISGGKQIVFDYDYQNVQTLQSALPNFVPSFDPSFRYVYTLAPHATNVNQALLTSTPLRVLK